MGGDTPVNRKVESGDTSGMFCCDTWDFRPFCCVVFLDILSRNNSEIV